MNNTGVQIKKTSTGLQIVWTTKPVRADVSEVDPFGDTLTCKVEWFASRGGEFVSVFTVRAELDTPRGLTELHRFLEQQVPVELVGVDSWWSYLNDLSRIVADEGSRSYGYEGLIGHAPETNIPPWIIEPLIGASITTLYASGGTGKSMLALWMGLIISHPVARQWANVNGIPVGEHVPHPSHVLYLDYETDAATVTPRINKLKSGLGITDDEMQLYYKNMSQPLVRQMGVLNRLTRDNNTQLLVVDSLAAASGADVENQQSMTTFFETTVKTLGHDYLGYQLPTLILHHTNRKTDPKQKENFHGSGYIRNQSRNMWEAKQTPNMLDPTAFDISLIHRKANENKIYPPVSLNMRFSEDEVSFRKQDIWHTDGAFDMPDTQLVYRAISESAPEPVPYDTVVERFKEVRTKGGATGPAAEKEAVQAIKTMVRTQTITGGPDENLSLVTRYQEEI